MGGVPRSRAQGQGGADHKRAAEGVSHERRGEGPAGRVSTDADAEPSKTERPAFEEYAARLKADPNCIFVEPLTHEQRTAELEADPRFVRVRTGQSLIMGGFPSVNPPKPKPGS
jgi:hypothetical protein